MEEKILENHNSTGAFTGFRTRIETSTEEAVETEVNNLLQSEQPVQVLKKS